MTLTIRPAALADAPQMAAIQNEIIAIGGTTAYQRARSVEAVVAGYITRPDLLCCHVAEEEGRVIGFQVVVRNDDLPAGWADIGTFVQQGTQARGIGGRLFQASAAACRAAGIATLNATIRADNVPGLAYYARMGFADHARDADWALDDGTVVGRISRRLDL